MYVHYMSSENPEIESVQVVLEGKSQFESVGHLIKHLCDEYRIFSDQ